MESVLALQRLIPEQGIPEDVRMFSGGSCVFNSCNGRTKLTNVLVSDTDTGAIRVIDLEAAWIKGRQKPSAFFTPGFASPTLNISARDERDDIYSLGSIMLGMLMPVNNLLELDPSLKKRPL